MTEPITAVIVGAGHRALTYASYAQAHPEALRIVGVADLIPLRREKVAALYNLPPERCFATAEELAAQPRFADCAINGTMDHQHVPTALPLLEAGYDMLLEKPFATNEEEMWALVQAARRLERTIAICHVLRYAPFYAAIRQAVIEDAIGQIINIQAVEHVSYHHMAVGFVRGKWARKEECHSPMLMAKCCHDLDLIAWMKAGCGPRAWRAWGATCSSARNELRQARGRAAWWIAPSSRRASIPRASTIWTIPRGGPFMCGSRWST